MPQPVDQFWSLSADETLSRVGSRREGLTGPEATQRLATFGPNALRSKEHVTWYGALGRQFLSPIVLLLIGAAILSGSLGDPSDAIIILTIVCASALLSFKQEYSAGNAVRKLTEMVQTMVDVLRDGKSQKVALEAVVPGDLVCLSAGSIVPGDGLILEEHNLFVNEAALTGETFPVEKEVGVVAADSDIARRTNSLFAGTNVVSGTGLMVIAKTGLATEFGGVAKRLQMRQPETDFERGIRQFGYLLIEFTLVLTLAVFAINVMSSRPWLESFMFALALAVGLTPQLLPAIITVNLSHGARQMAQARVIVKRLAAIESFGSMDVLCSDKTGTLTKGVVTVQGACDAAGNESPRALQLAQVNASLQSGFQNPIDDALKATTDAKLLAELPYDFLRKKLSVLVELDGEHLLISKGALEPILEGCTKARSGADLREIDSVRDDVMKHFADFSGQGLRVLGIASRVFDEPPTSLDPDDEKEMVFEGFLRLEDPLRDDSAATVARLRELGVRLKMITGDNRLVAAQVGTKVGLDCDRVLTGSDLRKMSDAALMHEAADVDVFAEIEPNQKEKLITSLRHGGHVVGYIGDGINDGAALHAADVSLSVASAVDVAKEAADFVMLDPGLHVLVQGVQEGRVTFANTLKYVYMASSANFGNMLSMAGASLMLPFLPLLPKQILLMNLMTDLPEMTIATDCVDTEMVALPRSWSLSNLRKFMFVFGTLSSVFDFATFLFLRALGESHAVFRAAWFVESIVSATLIVLVIRTRRPFFRSTPSRPLVLASLAIIGATLALPYTVVGEIVGFAPLPLPVMAAMLGIAAAYVVSAEFAKRVFRKVAVL